MTSVASSSHPRPEQRKAAEKWLTKAIGTDRRVVTFRELAREVGCHVHLAKNLLQDYHSSHPSVSPTYLISGPLLGSATLAQTSLPSEAPMSMTQSLAHMSGTQMVRIVDMDQVSEDERNSEADEDEVESGPQVEDIKVEDDDEMTGESVSKWGVVLVDLEGLEGKKLLFVRDQVSVHIYALAPSPVKDPALYLTSALNTRQHSDYVSPSVYGTITGASMVEVPKAMRDGAMNFGNVKGAKSTMPKPNEPPARANDAGETVARTASSKSRLQAITSDIDGSSKKAESSMDLDVTDEANVEPTSSMIRADDQAAMEAMMAMDVDLDDDDGEPLVYTKKDTTTVKNESGEKKKRKRRLVKKTRVGTDEKGYTVSKDYFTEESCSGSDTETVAMPVPRLKQQPSRTASVEDKKPLQKPSGAKLPLKKAPTGQSTLAGFFKKK